MIREDFLQQNAFVDIDSFSDYRRQAMMMQLILDYDNAVPCRHPEGCQRVQPVCHRRPRAASAAPRACPCDQYEQTYARIAEDMTSQIEEIAERGEVD